jgi:hypothetical protein
MATYFKHRTETDLELKTTTAMMPIFRHKNGKEHRIVTATVIAHKNNTAADKEPTNLLQTESATAR